MNDDLVIARFLGCQLQLVNDEWKLVGSMSLEQVWPEVIDEGQGEHDDSGEMLDIPLGEVGDLVEAS